MPDLGPLVDALSPILGAALKAFIRTTVGMIFTGVAVSSGCFYVAAQGSWTRGLLASLVALVLFAVVGLMLAVKRAVMGSLVEGLKKHRLGQRVAGALFDRITGILSYADTQGTRGNAGAKSVEKVPLARAEAVLASAVQELVKAGDGGGITGWLRRKIQGSLLEKVEAITLAKFRTHGADVGGVDLGLVRGELCDVVDVMILEKLRGAVTRVTAMFVMGAMVAAGLAAMGIRTLNI